MPVTPAALGNYRKRTDRQFKACLDYSADLRPA